MRDTEIAITEVRAVVNEGHAEVLAAIRDGQRQIPDLIQVFSDCVFRLAERNGDDTLRRPPLNDFASLIGEATRIFGTESDRVAWQDAKLKAIASGAAAPAIAAAHDLQLTDLARPEFTRALVDGVVAGDEELASELMDSIVDVGDAAIWVNIGIGLLGALTAPKPVPAGAERIMLLLYQLFLRATPNPGDWVLESVARVAERYKTNRVLYGLAVEMCAVVVKRQNHELLLDEWLGGGDATISEFAAAVRRALASYPAQE